MRRVSPWLARLYARALQVLPRRLRQRAGAEMQATFEARLAASPTRARRLLDLLHELAGVVRVAIVARAGAEVARGAPLRPHWPVRRAGVLADTLSELRHGGRALWRRPGVTSLALLTLALGVGASTAMFSVIDAVLLKPLPFERPEQIVFVTPTIEEWRDHPSLGANWQRGRFSGPELHAWLERQRSFDAAAGYMTTTARIPRGGGAESIPVASSTPELFRVLRVQPAHGRLYVEVEEEPVAVLAYAFWQTHHGGDAGIIGRDIVLNDRNVRVIGVLPRAFELPGIAADVWRPFQPSATAGLDVHTMEGIGRLRDGVTRAQAAAEAAAIVRSAAAADARHLTHGMHLIAPTERATQAVRTPLLILLYASLLLLGAACANVALLLLGAGAERVRELAVRGALGADKLRIARQLLAESVVLSAAGAAAGLVVAKIVIRLLTLIAPPDIPRFGNVALDLRAFGFAALLAVATGVVVGCLPALSLSRVRAADALRAGATAPGRGRLQRAIVIAELALATVLLIGAGLLTRTMGELQRVRPGFDPDGLVTVQLTLPLDRLRAAVDSWDDVGALVNAHVERLLAAFAALPGVDAVTLPGHMPYSGDRGTTGVAPEGYAAGEDAHVDAAFRIVAGNYFDVMRIAPLHGRLLGPADDHPEAERVMVVNDRFARTVWPDGRWLDRSVGYGGSAYRVVGVIADTREQDLRGDQDALKFYVSARGNHWGPVGAGNFIIRSTRPAEALMPELRAAVWSVDETIVIRRIAGMRERMAGSIADYRYRMRLMAAFSTLAAVFSLLGIYGVMSRTVARRRQELGVRVALGAGSADIVADVVGDGVRTSVAGVAIGLAAALASTRLLESIIWGVARSDTATFTAIAGALIALSALASLYPALRAAAVEPMSILRSG